MRFLPVFLSAEARPVILVGCGPQAVAKLHLLRAAGVEVRWFSPQVDEGPSQLSAHSAHDGHVAFGEPGADDIKQALAVVSAAGGEIDERIAARARALRVPVNVVDRLDLSTFIFPAIVNRGEVVVAIGTGGASPVLARRLRERIEALLPARIGELAALMKRYRDSIVSVRKRKPQFSARRFWERIVDGPVGAALLAGRSREAEALLSHAVADAGIADHVAVGAVHLVGAGPGDPDLLTLRALQALQNADAVFHDELVTPAILDRARRDAEIVPVGRRKGHPGIGQDEINRRLAAAAREGKQVVRLKSGDPFVFGRGGEEMEYLRQAGVPVFVVPGITAALGCAAEAGLPLTFRQEATRLSIVTASTVEGAETVDWSSLADPQATVVVYMGLTAAVAVQKGLIGAGRHPATPAAVLARGTRPDSRAVVGRLDELTRLAAEAGEGPALLVIGDVVARSDAWRAGHAHSIGFAA